jgi:hypothetical protein
MPKRGRIWTEQLTVRENREEDPELLRQVSLHRHENLKMIQRLLYP